MTNISEDLETTIVEDLRVKKRHDDFWVVSMLLYLAGGSISVICSYAMKNNGNDINYLLYVLLWAVIVIIFTPMILFLPLVVKRGNNFYYSGRRHLNSAVPSIIVILTTSVSFSYFLVKVIKLDIEHAIVANIIFIILSVIFTTLTHLKVRNSNRTNEWKSNYNINPVELSLIKSRQELAGIDSDRFPPYSKDMLNLNVEEWRYLKTELELAGYNISKKR